MDNVVEFKQPEPEPTVDSFAHFSTYNFSDGSCEIDIYAGDGFEMDYEGLADKFRHIAIDFAETNDHTDRDWEK